ncbi:PREDICTED: uncharacterized protein LOC105117775 [Populus euphratica]|uniref:Uncharacterized protein LOC105117775 n=2 Tax=Populus euphratica TaxID=75702 RepID=A0AAJ6XCT5_POPEU|nr:PREDICTED: uncharacterized protein LOC105117775 [Populus euphratica]
MLNPQNLVTAYGLARMQEENLSIMRKSWRPSAMGLQGRSPTPIQSRAENKPGPGYKCGGPRIFLIEEVDEEVEEKTCAPEDLIDLGEPPEEGNEDIGISLHAIIGSPNPKTMRVEVKLSGHNFVALIDTGSTHNFIHPRVARRVGMKVLKHKPIRVNIADVMMAVIADFMLVFLPAPTVSLRSPLAGNAGPIAKFFHNCPDNAFQVALAGTSYSLLQRLGAIARNGAKLFVVGTASSLVGTAVTNTLINARKTVDKSSAGEVENVPILSTSVAYGVYMAVSSNLRYQILAGVVEQRILEPMLHQHKLMLGALCFAVRTGNTFLGSLLWVDYARLIGIQKAHEEHREWTD